MPTWMIPMLLMIAALPAGGGDSHAPQHVELGDLDLGHMSCGWGTPRRDRSIIDKPLAVGGTVFERGVGTHADSALWIDLHGAADRFTARVGVDDATAGRGSVKFYVYADGQALFESELMKGGDAARRSTSTCAAGGNSS